MANTSHSKWKSRKLAAFLTLFALVQVYFGLDMIGEDSWLHMTQNIFYAFVLGNVGEHFSRVMKQ